MSTYTPSLGLELITPGTQAGLWGNTTNNTFNLIDQAITGVTPISFAGVGNTTYTLTDFNGAADEARSAVLNITGVATATNTVVIPNKQKTYLVRNSTGRDITFQTLAATTPTTVPDGNNTLIFCDGNNGVFPGILVPGAGTLGVNGGGTGKTTFTTAGFLKTPGGTSDFTSSATVDAASELSGIVSVSNGGTGVTSFTSGGVLLGNGAGALSTVTASPLNNGYVLTWDGSKWIAAAAASGISTFSAGSTGLTPASPTSGNIVLGGTLVAANGGTGLANPASGYVLLGGGTGSCTALGGSSPNQVLTWNGSAWAASTPAVLSVTGSTTATVNTTSGNAVVSLTSGNVTTALGATPVYTTTDQSIGGSKTFTGTITSSAYNFASSVSTYYGSNLVATVIGSQGMWVTSAGDFVITGSNATKASGTTWANPSDSRLKDNVQDYTKGLSTLTQIQPKTWTFNGKGGSQAGTHGRGVIADQIASVLPDSVTTYKAKLDESDAVETDIKMFNADEIIWILVNSVKELKAEVDALKAAK